jgi:phosphonate transport system permease protein
MKKTLKFIKTLFIPDDIQTKDGTLVTPPKPIMPYVLIALVIIYLFAVRATSFSIITLFDRLFDFQYGPYSFVKRFFPPDWSYWKEVIDPILETIQMSFLGSLIGSLFALPAAYFASQNLTQNRVVISLVRLFLSIFRTLPILIYAVFFKLIFGLGALPGTIAIALFTFSIVAKMLYERIETLDLGAYHAIESTGATKMKSFSTSLMPEIAPIYYSLSLYAFEINIRYAAILGYVGAGGIGFILDNAMKNIPQNDRTIVILLFIFVTVILIENTSRYLRKKLG